MLINKIKFLFTLFVTVYIIGYMVTYGIVSR